MDNFKPKGFNWTKFQVPKLDYSHLKIYEESEILMKIKNVSSLETIKGLTLAENNLTSVPYDALTLVQNSLQYLDLQGNNFFVNYNIIENQGEDIITWARFPNMPNLEILNLDNCNLQFIIPNMFINITNIHSLSLANNNIIRIPEDSFKHIPHLVNLDLSRMNSNLYQKNDESLSLESYMELMECGGLTIDELTFENLRNLEYINLSRSRISAKTKAFQHFGSNLKYLGLCSTQLQILDNNMFAKGTIKVLDLSANPYMAINLNNNSFQGLETSLKVLWFAESTIKKIFWLDKLKNLEYLNLSMNNINSLTNKTFASMKNLRYLDLNLNNIGNWYYQVFKNNSNLKILNFQETNINIITPEMYKDFAQVDFIALSKNNFVCKCYLRTLIEHAQENGENAMESENNKNFIWYLNNQNNSEYFQAMMSEVIIEKYYDGYLQSQEDIKNSTSIEYFNEDEHEHSHLYNLQLLDYNEEDYWCYSGSAYYKWNEVNYCKKTNIIEEELNETVKIIICGLVVFFVVSIIFTIIYLKKYNVKKFFYKIKKYFCILTGKRFIEPNSIETIIENYKYDVFVSYSDHDREWILEELIPNMDSDTELKICLHEREFKVGLTIWENIIHHMDKSRSLLLVVSSNFLQSNWCQFEMQFAQKRLFDSKRNQLVLIFLEDIPYYIRPRTLQHLMDIRTYIKWPKLTGITQKDAELKEIFWSRIKKSLKNND